MAATCERTSPTCSSVTGAMASVVPVDCGSPPRPQWLGLGTMCPQSKFSSSKSAPSRLVQGREQLVADVMPVTHGPPEPAWLPFHRRQARCRAKLPSTAHHRRRLDTPTVPTVGQCDEVLVEFGVEHWGPRPPRPVAFSASPRRGPGSRERASMASTTLRTWDLVQSDRRVEQHQRRDLVRGPRPGA